MQANDKKRRKAGRQTDKMKRREEKECKKPDDP